MIRGVITASMIDWPGHVSSVIFLGKCDWICEYCHNRHIQSRQTLTFDETVERMNLVKGMVRHVIISGGEPTIWDEYLDTMVDELISMGYKVGIHTNGSRPDILRKITGKLSFIGMDIKGSEEIYKNYITGAHFPSVKKSAEVIMESGIDYEFRSTMYPPFVTEERIYALLLLLESWRVPGVVLQQFIKVADDDPLPVKYSNLKSIVDSYSGNVKVMYRGFDKFLTK